jgi:hypothetical protein
MNSRVKMCLATRCQLRHGHLNVCATPLALLFSVLDLRGPPVQYIDSRFPPAEKRGAAERDQLARRGVTSPPPVERPHKETQVLLKLRI